MVAVSGVGDQSVVTDAVEAGEQHMQQEAAHEFIRTERHGLVLCLALGAVVFPLEGDTALIEGDEPAVSDGDPALSVRRQATTGDDPTYMLPHPC